MFLSHSKLNKMFECPMSFYLNYKQKIHLKVTKPALAIGSAVHWGIENNTEDLLEYFNEHGSFYDKGQYTPQQCLAESMVHGYLIHKNEILSEILKDEETGEQLECYEEMHELTLYAPLKSFRFDKDHTFMGIIDLLLLTDKGFIIIDYKTASEAPDWNKYLEQIYRYIFLLKHNFPDVPVYKIGIISLIKSKIKQKKNENLDSFMMRLKTEYDINEGLLYHHTYSPNEFSQSVIDDYINNLSVMADTAQILEENECYFINYSNANGIYGPSEYYDIFYHTENAFLLYEIEDTLYDEDLGELKVRDCVDIDMMTIDHKNVLNHYSDFKELLDGFRSVDFEPVDNWEDIKEALKQEYICNDELLDKYFLTYNYYKGKEDILKK